MHIFESESRQPWRHLSRLNKNLFNLLPGIASTAHSLICSSSLMYVLLLSAFNWSKSQKKKKKKDMNLWHTQQCNEIHCMLILIFPIIEYFYVIITLNATQDSIWLHPKSLIKRSSTLNWFFCIDKNSRWIIHYMCLRFCLNRWIHILLNDPFTGNLQLRVKCAKLLSY